jgi:demethylmenaquinone methyltransferase/2-methoxy-6-polyprenyl-1,4-benzoquinol methylase
MIDKRSSEIRGMFRTIAPWYDFLNHLLSFQQDRLWRRRLVRLSDNSEAGRAPRRILDLCSGTGDLALGFARVAEAGDLVVGADFTEAMLQRAQEKAAKAKAPCALSMVCGDALRLPFEDATFDVVTAAFGVRNFENLTAGLREMMRVTAPGGQVLILEFSQPRSRGFRALYLWYFTRLLPVIGRLFTRTNSYSYLRDSVLDFPDRLALKKLLEECGLRSIEIYPLTLGVALIHAGRKPLAEQVDGTFSS